MTSVALLKWNFLHWLKFTVIRGLGNEIGNKFLKNTKRMLNIYCAKWNSCQVCNRWTIWKKLLISSKVHKSIWHSMRRISSEVFAFWSPFNSDWQFISNHLSILQYSIIILNPEIGLIFSVTKVLMKINSSISSVYH